MAQIAFWKVIVVLHLVLTEGQLTISNGQYIYNNIVVPVSSQKCSHCMNTLSNSTNTSCCLTADELEDYLQSKDTVQLTFETHTHIFKLKKTMVFRNLTLLKIGGSITSDSEFTTLRCAEKDIGLNFENIYRIELENVKIEKCGARHNNSIIDKNGLPQIIPFSSSLLFNRCSYVCLNNIPVSQGVGIGITIHPIAGWVSLHRCVLFNNSDGGCKVGGGGLYIVFKYQNYLLSSNHSSVSIHISNCTFKQNHANLFSNALLENTLYGQGSGISVIFRDGLTSGHHIKITECVLSNNTAQQGGGLLIVSTNNSINNSVVTRYKNIENAML